MKDYNLQMMEKLSGLEQVLRDIISDPQNSSQKGLIRLVSKPSFQDIGRNRKAQYFR